MQHCLVASLEPSPSRKSGGTRLGHFVSNELSKALPNEPPSGLAENQDDETATPGQ